LKQSTKPYARPPRLPIGDAEPEPIYLAVGFALSIWERLESDQARLFSVLVDGGRSIAASRAYGLAIPARLKKDMIGVAAETLFHPGEEELFKRIKDAAQLTEEWSNRRNDIAHGQAQKFIINDVEGDYYLMPARHSTKNVNEFNSLSSDSSDEIEAVFGAYSYAYTSDQIHGIIRGFENHRQLINTLVFEVINWRKAKFGQ
jgi:hypothetical protein